MITLQIASLKQRESSLKVAIASLIDQVDKIRIACNEYPEIPDWMRHNPKIEGIRKKNELMDGERFVLNETNEGYILFCDDDLKYPPDFVDTMIKHLDSLAHPAIISIMGANLCRPLKSYHNDQQEYYSAVGYISKMHEVEMIGMCGAITHSSYFKMTTKDIKVMNSDINTSVYCKNNGIKKYVVPHRADWCEDLMKTLPPDSFTVWNYNKPRSNDQVITKFINENF